MTELAYRRSEDVEVSLFWDRKHDQLFVLVEDMRVVASARIERRGSRQ